jgi:hypothetical protein
MRICVAVAGTMGTSSQRRTTWAWCMIYRSMIESATCHRMDTSVQSLAMHYFTPGSNQRDLLFAARLLGCMISLWRNVIATDGIAVASISCCIYLYNTYSRQPAVQSLCTLGIATTTTATTSIPLYLAATSASVLVVANKTSCSCCCCCCCQHLSLSTPFATCAVRSQAPHHQLQRLAYLVTSLARLRNDAQGAPPWWLYSCFWRASAIWLGSSRPCSNIS